MKRLFKAISGIGTELDVTIHDNAGPTTITIVDAKLLAPIPELQAVTLDSQQLKQIVQELKEYETPIGPGSPRMCACGAVDLSVPRLRWYTLVHYEGCPDAKRTGHSEKQGWKRPDA